VVVRCRRQDLLRRDSVYLFKNCLLCAKHFEDSQFMNAAEKNKLIWNALPSLFDVKNAPPRLQLSRRQIVRTLTSKTSSMTSAARCNRSHNEKRNDHNYCLPNTRHGVS
jgi:hypothetical protein